jgi:hypothetical protein
MFARTLRQLKLINVVNTLSTTTSPTNVQAHNYALDVVNSTHSKVGVRTTSHVLIVNNNIIRDIQHARVQQRRKQIAEQQKVHHAHLLVKQQTNDHMLL